MSRATEASVAAPALSPQAGGPSAPPSALPRATGPEPEPLRRDDDVATAVGPLLAVLRQPLLVALSILVVLAAGLAVGIDRAPTYKAEAQLLVGRVDVEANAVPGFVSATQQLAGTYARIVSTTVIEGRVAAALKIPVADVSGRLRADPIPESSLIRITASAASEARAVALAKATSTELIAYLQATNDNPARRKALLDEYGTAAQELQQLQLTRIAAEQDLAQATLAGRPARQAAVAAARAAVDRATLRRDAAAQAFTDGQRGAADRGTLQLVSEAQPLGDDGASRLRVALVASLVLGSLLGVGLASVKENGAVLRRLRRRTGSGAQPR